MEQILIALEDSGAAQTLRRSTWLYPTANVAHVLGLMAFFATVAAMDVKAMRATSRDALRVFISRLRPLAILLLLVMVVSGVMLFLPEATHMAHNGAFQLKLLAVAVAILNVMLFETSLGRNRLSDIPPAGLRVSAFFSMLLWLGIAALGRLIAYV